MLRLTYHMALDQLFPLFDRRRNLRPFGTGRRLHLVPRVPFACGELHSWLQPVAPLGPHAHCQSREQWNGLHWQALVPTDLEDVGKGKP